MSEVLLESMLQVNVGLSGGDDGGFHLHTNSNAYTHTYTHCLFDRNKTIALCRHRFLLLCFAQVWSLICSCDVHALGRQAFMEERSTHVRTHTSTHTHTQACHAHAHTHANTHTRILFDQASRAIASCFRSCLWSAAARWWRRNS